VKDFGEPAPDVTEDALHPTTCSCCYKLRAAHAGRYSDSPT
jgi:hypothetical protein